MADGYVEVEMTMDSMLGDAGRKVTVTVGQAALLVSRGVAVMADSPEPVGVAENASRRPPLAERTRTRLATVERRANS